MSRAGTPTDNPIIESLNGWMKAELILDFGISKVSNLKKTLDQYVLYFNSERFAAALDYKTPIQYRVKGSGSQKEFVTGSGKSFRSSKI